MAQEAELGPPLVGFGSQDNVSLSRLEGVLGSQADTTYRVLGDIRSSMQYYDSNTGNAVPASYFDSGKGGSMTKLQGSGSGRGQSNTLAMALGDNSAFFQSSRAVNQQGMNGNAAAHEEEHDGEVEDDDDEQERVAAEAAEEAEKAAAAEAAAAEAAAAKKKADAAAKATAAAAKAEAPQTSDEDDDSPSSHTSLRKRRRVDYAGMEGIGADEWDDEEGSSAAPRREAKKYRKNTIGEMLQQLPDDLKPIEHPPGLQEITLRDELILPQHIAAQRLNLCPSTFSKRWKAAAGRPWPHRAVCKLDRELMAILGELPQRDKDAIVPLSVREKLKKLLAQRKQLLKPTVIQIGDMEDSLSDSDEDYRKRSLRKRSNNATRTYAAAAGYDDDDDDFRP